MVYFQLASNELNVNCYPDFLKIMNNFNEFLSQFPIIDKVKDYRPFIKPTNGNNLNYMNLVENYRKNVIDNKNKGKMLVRDWINYIYWFQKSKNGEKRKIINPIRTEFVRFYNICFKKMDIHEKKEEKAPLKEEKNKNKEKSTNSNPNPPETKTTETPTPKENETPTEIKEPEEKLIPKDFEFSSRIDLLIKGLNISLHSSLDDKVKEYISICINGVEIKIRLDKTIFEFNLKVKTIDLGPSNLIVGERVIIQPKSYRKAIPEQSMTSLKTNIPYGNLSTYNYISLPNSELGSNITGLIKKYNPRHEEKIKVIDEALELAQSQSRVMSLAASEFGDVGKFRGPKIKSKTPFGNEGENLGHSIINVNINNNVNDLGKTYGTVLVPRNVSFAKNLIDGYEANSLQNRKYQRKKDKEMNISQAINDYNSYKIYEKSKNKFRTSHSPQPSLSSSRFNLRESRFGINPVSARNKNTPLNLLEIFSNTEVGALSIKFTKYNNPITIDNLAIQIGTIRLNLFVNYLLDILRILSDFKKATNIPKIAKSEGPNAVSGKIILEIQEYFYKYITEKMPDKDKTESVIEYMEYLRKEISSKKKFSSKPQHYDLNQIFTVFPKGFDFHFDYENIELVAYDKNNIVSTKMIIPSNEFIFGINFTKIFIKLLDLEMDISDLNRCESIIDQLKGLAEDKFKVVQIVLKPCYKEIKEGIEPLLKDNEEEYKQILKNANNNINLNNNNDNINAMVNIPQDNAQNLVKNEQKNINQENILLQKNKENELLDLMIKNHKDNELLIQKQKEKSQSYLSQQLNNQQILHPSQIQQKKNNSNIAKIPKIPHISQNYNQLNQNDALPKSPRDSKRSKNSENQMSKIEGTSSYQLVGDTVYLGQQQIMNNNYNSNLDYLGNNHLSNTQYNLLAPNMNNYGYNEFYKTYQNENNNNFV